MRTIFGGSELKRGKTLAHLVDRLGALAGLSLKVVGAFLERDDLDGVPLLEGGVLRLQVVKPPAPLVRLSGP